MPILCLAGSIRSAFFQLPPQIRSATFAKAISCPRHFSSTARRDVDPISIVTAAPIFLMDSLHTIGLSWAAVIPCTALVLRGVLNHYLIALPQRKQAQQRAAVTPLIHAYTLMYRDRPIERERQKKIRESSANITTSFATYAIGLRLRSTLSAWWELSYLTGISRLSFFGSRLASFGILISAMEAIREKCGLQRGLLGWLISPFTEAIAAARRTLEAQQADQVLGMDPGTTSAMSADVASQATLNPTLQTEGLPWCSDLTTFDPTGVLPVALFFAIAVPTVLSPLPLTAPQPRKSPVQLSTFEEQLNTKENEELADLKRDAERERNILIRKYPRFAGRLFSLSGMQKFTLCFAGYIAMVAMKMPVGMVLYLVSSWTVGFMHRLYLDQKYPPVKPITPCTRPMRKRRRPG